MFGFLKKLAAAAKGETPQGNLGVDELSRRLGVPEQQLRSIEIAYRVFQVPKRTGGARTITAPAEPLKKIQRTILRRLLGKLKAHPAATGFESGYSIVSNAIPHVRQDVVIKLDIKDFFSSTSAARVDAYFRRIGWNADAAALLTQLCTNEGALPQGAPTSPRLSNLLNYKLDARIAAAAQKRGLAYSRYADDMTFSGSAVKKAARATNMIHIVKQIVKDDGYILHTDKKLRIARRGDRQVVTGLVVNAKVNLPRRTRRRLRAIDHHIRTGKPATLTSQQLAGWKSLQAMIKAQAATP